MPCIPRRKTCLQVVESGGDYLLSTKENQPATYQAIVSLFGPAARNLTNLRNTILSLFAPLGCGNAAQTRRRLDTDLGLAFSPLISAHPRLSESRIGVAK